MLGEGTKEEIKGKERKEAQEDYEYKEREEPTKQTPELESDFSEKEVSDNKNKKK